MKTDLLSLASSPVASIFLYGTHEAYLAHKLNELIKNLSQEQGAQSQWVDQATFLSDSTILYNQGDLFAPISAQKLVIIQDATDKCAKAIEAHLLSPSKGVRIVIPGMIGTSVRKLKTLHEKASNGAFVPCYLSQVRDKQVFIEEITNRHGLRLSREAQALVFQRLDNDLESILSAFKKLEFYLEDKTSEVTSADLDACISDFSEATVQPMIAHIGDRNLPQTLRAYHEAKILGLEEMYMIRSLNAHFSKLLALRGLMKEGMNIAQAMQAMRPPIFFKQEDEFRRHVGKWQEGDIVQVMGRLNDIELQIKTGYLYDTVQLWKPVFSLCRMG